MENKIPELLVQFNDTLSKGFDGQHFIAGLASHFRDLMVSQSPQTIELLEVGEDTKTKYMEQSKKASYDFLLKGIELANDCDLKYKSSKNQRLLVELTLMQLASITFDGEKKNSSPFIIPASYFRAKGIKPIPVTIPNKAEPVSKTIEKIAEIKTVETPKAEVSVSQPIPVIDLIDDTHRTSGLSIKSIKARKEHLIRQMEVIVDPNDLPKETVLEAEFIKVWKAYVKGLDSKGERIMASILEMDTPKLKDTTIHLEFPNETLKIELERAQFPLMEYLRKTLKNYDLTLEISVNEEIEKHYSYTPMEKYQKLKEKNPNIDLLKKTFGLDV